MMIDIYIYLNKYYIVTFKHITYYNIPKTQNIFDISNMHDTYHKIHTLFLIFKPQSFSPNYKIMFQLLHHLDLSSHRILHKYINHCQI